MVRYYRAAEVRSTEAPGGRVARAQFDFDPGARQSQTQASSFSAASPGSWLAKFSSKTSRHTLGSISSSALRVGRPCTDCMREETTTSFALVALSRMRASSTLAVVMALYPALHSTSRRNVPTSVDSQTQSMRGLASPAFPRE